MSRRGKKCNDFVNMAVFYRSIWRHFLCTLVAVIVAICKEHCRTDLWCGCTFVTTEECSTGGMAWDDFKEPSTFQAQEGFYWARECFVFTCFSSIWTVGGSREINSCTFYIRTPRLRSPATTAAAAATDYWHTGFAWIDLHFCLGFLLHLFSPKKLFT